MALILWVLAVGLVLYGLYLIFVEKRAALGIVLVIVGLLIGPGGVSIFTADGHVQSLAPFVTASTRMGGSVPFAP